MEAPIKCPKCQTSSLVFQSLGVECSQCDFRNESNATCKECRKRSTEVACLCAFQTPICDNCWPVHSLKLDLDHRRVLQYSLRNINSDDDFSDLKAKMFRLGRIQGKVREKSKILTEAIIRLRQVSEEAIKRVEAETRALQTTLETLVTKLNRSIARLESMKFDFEMQAENDLERWALDPIGRALVPYPESALAGLTPSIVICDDRTEEVAKAFQSLVSITAPVVSFPLNTSSLTIQDEQNQVDVGCGKKVETGWFGDRPVVLTCGHFFHDSECFFEFLKGSSNWFQNPMFYCPVDSLRIHQNFIEQVFGKKDFMTRVQGLRAKCWKCRCTENISQVTSCKKHHFLCMSHKQKLWPKDEMPCPCLNHNPWVA